MNNISLDQAIRILNLFSYRQCSTWTNTNGLAQGPPGIALTAFEATLVAVAEFNPWVLGIQVPWGA